MQKNQLKIKQGREADIGKNDNTEKLASRRNVDKEMTIPNRYNLQNYWLLNWLLNFVGN